MSEILTIKNHWHAGNRIWICAEPQFMLSWMKLCSSDSHCTTTPIKTLWRSSRYPNKNLNYCPGFILKLLDWFNIDMKGVFLKTFSKVFSKHPRCVLKGTAWGFLWIVPRNLSRCVPILRDLTRSPLPVHKFIAQGFKDGHLFIASVRYQNQQCCGKKFEKPEASYKKCWNVSNPIS